ncbi:tetratricopeptide repeat protein [Coralloluteibacterium thermophilus]|uniref:Tetratricopeptide repeat protein n=1 Tax=Coralloluteibacterium thermophilum TaxID=2707049 RepID=A0ABV9NHB5_9GAMM
MNETRPTGGAVRALFEAVCDLPPATWRARLEALTGDAHTIEEVMALLAAQTVDLQRAAGPLAELMARLPGGELEVGDVLGAWRLVECIGEGGMGSVFVAERADGLFRQRVAIKLLRGLAGPAAVERLAVERQILAELQHPSIARLHDGGTTPAGNPYLVMEYVPGLPVDAWCRTRGCSLPQRLALFVRICRAVQAAHQQLVVHCDIKPSNVLVREDGEPVLLDFGIARLQGGGDGGGYGTPGYASPEQLDGRAPGVASDVFGLGVLLVELLAGTRARSEGRRVSPPSELVPPGRLRRALRGDLDAICARACATEPAARYPSVDALADDVVRAGAHYPVRARPRGSGYRLRCFLRRRWRGAAVAAAMMLMAVGFVWQLAAERERAALEAHTAREVADFLVGAFEAADVRRRGARATDDVSAREVLDAAALRIERELVEQPELRARLMQTLGHAYSNIGERDPAIRLLREAGALYLGGDVGRPLAAAEAYSELAVALANAGQGTAAVDAGERALALRERSADPLLRADAKNSLGLAYAAAGRLADAVAASEEAYALRRTHLGPRHDSTATSLHNLAQVARRRGDLARAESAYREALGIRRDNHGNRTTEYANTLNGLAGTLVSQGRHADAVGMMREALALARSIYGEDSPRVGHLRGELAGALQGAGDFDAAEAEYRSAQRIEAAAGGETSLDQARFTNNLASLLEVRGRLLEAEDGYRRSLEIRRMHLGEREPPVVRARSNLARLLMRTGRIDEARPMLASALADWIAVQGEDSVDTVITRIGFAELELLSGRLDAARAELARVGGSALLAQSAPLRLRRDAIAARIADAGPDPEAAGRAWAEVVAAAEEQGGVDHVQTATFRLARAHALQRLGSHAAAREELDAAEPVLRRVLAPDADALRRLDGLRAGLPPAVAAARG